MVEELSHIFEADESDSYHSTVKVVSWFEMYLLHIWFLTVSPNLI